MENLNSSTGQKILIVTDAWRQINGVVTTLENLNRTLTDMKYDVDFLNYDDADYTCNMPFYPEVKLAWVKQYVIKRKVDWADSVHIATPEGPIGFKTLRYCVKNKIPFTTGYHTKWPEFVRARLPIPTSLTYAYMRWLHKHSKNILVPTQTVVDELRLKGFCNLVVWTRGVDRTIFNPGSRTKLICGKPLLLCVTRVSHEKGLDDFCKLVYPGATKIIVGDGPYRAELEVKYPDVIFTGVKRGKDLADYYANADVFVFPSKSDTFGVVMIESMACGTPVAAFPVTGPLDVIKHGVTGAMDNNLNTAIDMCLTLDRKKVYNNSLEWSWGECAVQFINSLTKKKS
jgi:glycosyltransferase involved in cell wall biosynthesis